MDVYRNRQKQGSVTPFRRAGPVASDPRRRRRSITTLARGSIATVKLLAREPGVRVAYVPLGAQLDADAVVLPGTKNTVDDLRADNEEFLGKVAQQIEASEELTTMLQNLEERYDSYMAGSTLGQPIIHAGDLPSADELAAELERFLADRRSDDDKRGRR